jgi:uncharacterized protein YukE
VSALDGFLSTWSQARTTFGQGTPSEGAQLDRSGQLRGLQDDVTSAAPGSNWTGSGSDTYAEANSRHARTLGNLADLDKRLGAEVDRSAAAVAAGRRDLDAVRQWVVDAAATVPRTAAGDRMLWSVVSKGSGELTDIINRSNGDLAAIAQRIRGLGGEYDELRQPKESPGAEPVNVKGDGDEKGDVPKTALDLNDIVQLSPYDPKDPKTFGPSGFKELVPGSGTWVPDPNSPDYRPTPVEAPLDLNDIEHLNPGTLGRPGLMELVPGSGTWVPDPSSPSYQPHPPQAPLDLNDIVIIDQQALGQPWEMELIPGSGVWVPDPNYGNPR